jgi:hypothetical protein|tara:strand:- start:563 stop:856 length:294 start_codon:yes stop_codon:yes gene_type:complete
MNPLEFATLMFITRCVYLNLPMHDFVYEKTGGAYNGYFVLAVGAYLLRVPVPLIVALVVGRKIYKECVGYQVAEDFNKPHSHIMFFLASYICGLARR